jgi:hypothetical protein
MSQKNALKTLPLQARKLLCLIARQSRAGTLRSKTPGTATMPEVHEACGLDVDGMYALLGILHEAGFVEIEGEYPFEAVKPVGEFLETILHKCEAAKIPIEDVVVGLRFELLV